MYPTIHSLLAIYKEYESINNGFLSKRETLW
jgi:hypothetical protein